MLPKKKHVWNTNERVLLSAVWLSFSSFSFHRYELRIREIEKESMNEQKSLRKRDKLKPINAGILIIKLYLEKLHHRRKRRKKKI